MKKILGLRNVLEPSVSLVDATNKLNKSTFIVKRSNELYSLITRTTLSLLLARLLRYLVSSTFLVVLWALPNMLRELLQMMTYMYGA